MEQNLILKDLPKISLNKWYAGEHWTKRKKIKDIYKTIIKSQFKQVLSKDRLYEVDYVFNFKTRALDASNCVAMVKLIEDVIFEDDSYKIVLKISIKSVKNTYDFVEMKIKTL